MGNNLRKARKEKNDEFYTQLTDIEKELRHYKDHFKGKVVYCNCDDPEKSNFWKYFVDNFETLQLKRLVFTHYVKEGATYKLEYLGMGLAPIMTDLKCDGDFRSDECVELLKEADIVVTNPPFSLFREYIAQLVEHRKKFLVIGNTNAITYKETFRLIMGNQIWLGVSPRSMTFQLQGGGSKDVNACWFTNLTHKKRNEELVLAKRYTPEAYPKYDNYDAINIDKISDIPFDYLGYMGVPITFLDKFNPDQFEIFGIMNTGEVNQGIRLPNTPHGRPVINGVEKYLRVIIKRKV